MSKTLETTSLVSPEEKLSSRDLKARVQLIQQVMKDVMIEKVHYGTIPGCPKPSLYKAGAEQLAATFQISIDSSVEDLSSADEKRYRVTCFAYSKTGVKLGSSVGECSSNEEKYRWRKPKCDQEFDETPVDRRREKWVDEKTKVKQVRTEPWDQANTILQMADKRAYVALVRKITAASDIFTQDLEDMTDAPEGQAEVKKPQPKAGALNSADFKQMKAKFAGKCKRCEKDIKVGDEQLYNSKLGVYHPNCLNPKEDAGPAQDLSAPAPKKTLEMLEKMAAQAKVKLIDRIGRDGKQSLDEINLGYANDLLAEFAEIIDGNKTE